MYVDEEMLPSTTAPVTERLAWALEFAADGVVVDHVKLWDLAVRWEELQRRLEYATETATSALALVNDLAEVHADAASARSEFFRIVRSINAPKWREFWSRR